MTVELTPEERLAKALWEVDADDEVRDGYEPIRWDDERMVSGERALEVEKVRRALAAARGSVQVEGAVEGREIIRRLLDAAEPKAHKNGPQADAEWGSRTGGIPDCPWCAAREFLTARLPERPDEGLGFEVACEGLREIAKAGGEAGHYAARVLGEIEDSGDRLPERPDEGERDELSQAEHYRIALRAEVELRKAAEARAVEAEKALRTLVQLKDRQDRIGPASSARGGLRAVAEEIREVGDAWRAARRVLSEAPDA